MKHSSARNALLLPSVAIMALAITAVALGRSCVGAIGTPISLIESRLTDDWILVYTDRYDFEIEFQPGTVINSKEVLSPGLGATVRIDGELVSPDILDSLWRTYLRCRWEGAELIVEHSEGSESAVSSRSELQGIRSTQMVLRGRFGELRVRGPQFRLRWSNA